MYSCSIQSCIVCTVYLTIYSCNCSMCISKKYTNCMLNCALLNMIFWTFHRTLLFINNLLDISCSSIIQIQIDPHCLHDIVPLLHNRTESMHHLFLMISISFVHMTAIIEVFNTVSNEPNPAATLNRSWSSGFEVVESHLCSISTTTRFAKHMENYNKQRQWHFRAEYAYHCLVCKFKALSFQLVVLR